MCFWMNIFKQLAVPLGASWATEIGYALGKFKGPGKGKNDVGVSL